MDALAHEVIAMKLERNKASQTTQNDEELGKVRWVW